MEQNLPIIAKKIWKIVRVVYFMLRKGISKGKLLSALNMMMKRGKIAGKEAIQSLIFHHHHQHHHAATYAATTRRPHEYEFSCGDSPATFHLPFHFNKRKSSGGPPAAPLSEKELMVMAAEIFYSTAASPVLSGFGPSPIVRQLRISDSPFPLKDFEEDNHVDEAAEEFIMKFYKDLKQQNSMACLSYS